MADGGQAYARPLGHLSLTDTCSKTILFQSLAKKYDKILICCITVSNHIVIYCYYKYPYIDRLGTVFAHGYAICLIVFPYVSPLLSVLGIEVGRNHGLVPSVHT